MNILLVVATEIEIEQVILENIRSLFKHNVKILVTGMGVPSTLLQLAKYIYSNDSKWDLIINLGIAGSFKDDIKIGEVVNIIEDTYADLGFDENDGFKHLSEITYFPCFFTNYQKTHLNIRKKRGITVNTVTGSPETKQMLLNKFNPDIESMESAAVFDICLKENIPFIVFRAISNKVGNRDKSCWNISLAVHNLWLTLYDFVKTHAK